MSNRVKSFKELYRGKDFLKARPEFVKSVLNGQRKIKILGANWLGGKEIM